jgi:hypothetical protein
MLQRAGARRQIAAARPNNGHVDRVRCQAPTPPETSLLRTWTLAAALLCLTVPAGAEERSSSWSSERMRLRPPPRVPTDGDELHGNCAGLTVMTRTRIEWLKTSEEKAAQQRWPPPSPMAQWASRPAGGDIARQREHIAQLNAALAAKGCPTLDVDAELRSAPASSGARARTR